MREHGKQLASSIAIATHQRGDAALLPVVPP
jgi:hypothetical protein